MNFRIYLILSFLLSFGIAKASHVPGGNITYECVGNNQYVVTLTLYEDCGTAFETNGAESISISNDCGYATPTSASLPNIVFQQEVSQLCNTQIGQSECNGGTLPGVYMHVWQDTITLPGNCDSWTFSYSSCCRNTSTNLVGSSDNYYWEAVLNSNTAPCNTAPAITSQPIPYVCVNQNVTYSLGAFEPDGNTLVYSLIDAMTSSTGIVSYQSGYNGSTPIPGITLDPNTGQIQFTPTTTGNYVVAVLIEEFDSNGNLVGSIVQDFQFEVINCSGNNNPPVPPATGISNFTGSGNQTGPTNIEVCEGDNFCFRVEFTGAATDSIYLTSNVAYALPGATITQLSYFSPAVAEICWTAIPGANPYSSVSINAVDNSCPTVGMSNMTVGVTVVSSTYAGADETICLGSGVQLQANGGSNFTWSVVSGDPITPGNFSCTNCQNPMASPSQTSIYEVVSNLSGGCTNTDTITVNVAPDFNYTVSQSSASTCLNTDIQLGVTTTPAGSYTYTWTPGAHLSSTTIPNPVASPSAPGTYDYYVDVESAAGCLKHDSLSINVAAAYSPDATVTLDTNLITCGDSVHMTTDLGGGVPAVCGASISTTCNAPSSTIAIGTGTTNVTSAPSPFYGFYEDGRIQIIYTAAELQAQGFVGGKITSLDFYITSLNSSLGYSGLNIGLMCSSMQNFNSTTTFLTGFTNVYSNAMYNPVSGWNTFTFQTAYEWDGISNLVVEVCFDNGNWTSTDQVAQNSTVDKMVQYDYTDGASGCTLSTPYTSTNQNNRPIIRFSTCPTLPDPSQYTFQWTGPAIDNPSAQDIAAAPVVTTDYQLVVTNTNGGCTDTVDVHVDVNCGVCMPANPTLTDITCFGGSDGQIEAQPIGADGPPFIVQLLDNTNSIVQADSNVSTTTLFAGLPAGSYTIRSIDTTGCFADTLVTLNEPTQVTLAHSNDTIVCIGGTATLIANATGGNGAPYSYIWIGLTGNSNTQNVNPTIANVYEFYAEDPMGCTTDTSQITVSMFPPILLTPSASDTVCPGDFGTVSVSANGGIGGTYFYNWTDEQGNSVGANSSLTIAPTHAPATYYVTVTDDCETPPSVDSVVIYWYQEPDVSFTSDIVDGCYPVDVTFVNTTDPNFVSSCVWDFGNNQTSVSVDTANNVYFIVGSYDVNLTVTSYEGCTSDTTYANYINVYGYPTADFGFTPNPTDVLHPEVTFIDSSTIDVTSFQWYFGDSASLGSSIVQNPSFTFPDAAPGTYPVELIVVNQYGCADTIEHTVIVNGVFNLFIPNTFTPNGDGNNDYFFPVGESVDPQDYHFYIFNKWGEKIFEANQLDSKWDGTFQGQPLQDGVYVWRIQLLDAITGEYYDYKGHVLLMR